MLSMKKVLVVLVAIIMILSFGACGKNDKSETIRFAIPRNDQHALAIIASEKGFFKEQGLKVEVTYLPTGVECYQALLSNSADIGTTMDVMIANFGFSGDTNVSVTASINTTFSTCVIARRSAGIEKPEDLRGKKLAMSPGMSSEIYTANFIDKYNLSGDVEIVKMQTNTISSAIISESVDAICAFGPFFYNALKSLGDDAIVFSGDTAFDALMIVNNDYASKNRDNVVRFIKALEQAATFSKENELEAQEIVAHVVNLDMDAVKEIWKSHDFHISLGDENLERVINIAEYYKNEETNKAKPFPDYSRFFDYSFLEELG